MKKATKTTPRHVSSLSTLPIPTTRVGRVVGVDARGWLVECTAGAAPVAARTTLDLNREAMQAAAEARREALLVFDADAANQPIVVGLLAEPPKAAVDAVVDGRRVTIDGQDEVVLRCGAASITLRRNGRVVIRGAYVETRAQGVNRIKGGSVQIN